MSGGSGSQYYSLRWNNHPINLVSVFTNLYQAETLVDVTLAAGGRHLQAHKVVLSACSEYFQSVFASNPCQHPVVILKDVDFEDLETVVKFIYHGIVNVSSEKLPAVLNTADALQIKGLEKTNELMASVFSSSSRSSQNLLSVPGQSRQLSTESVPDYLQRSRSDAGYYPQRGGSFESRVEVVRPKRVLTPPLSPSHEHITSGNFARKKFRNRSENASSSFSTSVEQQSLEEQEMTQGVSPCRQSDSSYPNPDTEHIAKKKRAMFQANKSSSSFGSRGSESQSRSLQLSSGQSNSHSSEREETATDSLSVPRPVMRSSSAEEGSSQSLLTTKFKRERFLKRQQCQEAAEETEGTPVTDPPLPLAPAQKMVKQHSLAALTPQHNSTPSQPKEEPVDPEEDHQATPGRQHSLDPLCGLESVPLLYSSSGPRLTPPNLFRPVLPTVRITKDTETDHLQEMSASQASPVSSVSQHFPLHPPPVMESAFESQYQDKKQMAVMSRLESSQPRYNFPRHQLDTSHSPGPSFGRQNISHDRHDQGRAEPPAKHIGQFGHCPKARDGPALSCNFCWNTTDGSGRILRRKTKYHCPECQTNLCIVPCFQQYHEALKNENTEMH